MEVETDGEDDSDRATTSVDCSMNGSRPLGAATGDAMGDSASRATCCCAMGGILDAFGDMCSFLRRDLT